MLCVPSLKPNRLRGVACAVDVDDVRPKPSCDQRTAVVPNPIRTRLRTACTATCGSSAQAWMHRSPPDSAGSIWSPVKRGSSASPGGFSAPSPSLSNSEAPTPKVSVSDAAGNPSASPVSVGGASGLRLTAPPGVVSAPATIRSAAAVHFRSRARTWAGSLVVRSSATKCSRSWAGVMIPACCGPRNGTTPSGAGSGAEVATE